MPKEQQMPQFADGWFLMREGDPDAHRIVVYTPDVDVTLTYRIIPQGRATKVATDATHWFPLNPPNSAPQHSLETTQTYGSACCNWMGQPGTHHPNCSEGEAEPVPDMIIGKDALQVPIRSQLTSKAHTYITVARDSMKLVPHLQHAAHILDWVLGEFCGIPRGGIDAHRIHNPDLAHTWPSLGHRRSLAHRGYPRTSRFGNREGIIREGVVDMTWIEKRNAVRSIFREAHAFSSFMSGLWCVYQSTKDGNPQIGEGATEGAAWEDAFDRLIHQGLLQRHGCRVFLSWKGKKRILENTFADVAALHADKWRVWRSSDEILGEGSTERSAWNAAFRKCISDGRVSAPNAELLPMAVRVSEPEFIPLYEVGKYIPDVCMGCGYVGEFEHTHQPNGDSDTVECPFCQSEDITTVELAVRRLREMVTAKDDEPWNFEGTPSHGGPVLVTWVFKGKAAGPDGSGPYVSEARFDCGQWKFPSPSANTNIQVIAWRDMPKPASVETVSTPVEDPAPVQPECVNCGKRLHFIPAFGWCETQFSSRACIVVGGHTPPTQLACERCSKDVWVNAKGECPDCGVLLTCFPRFHREPSLVSA
jgi:hypothetical protein